MEDSVAGGTLTAKTHWREYCMKVGRPVFIPLWIKYCRSTNQMLEKSSFLVIEFYLALCFL